jgi:hypothetical protein|tara:strand:+ start:491 stop:805 length:315 start_codon:yes stop_codon:yes gene_type:complete
MAISGNIVTMGNLTATGAYLRVSDITTKKIIDTTSDNNGKWQMMYGVDCYVSADERASASPSTLVAPTVDRFKVVTDDEPSDPYAAAYANLKTQSAVASPSDLV